MTTHHSNIQAVRAVIAILIRITLGKALLLVIVIAGVIGILAGYNAWRGMSLLWIISTFALLITLTAAAIGLLVYGLTHKILPRQLKAGERRRIAHFAKELRSRLIMLRVPLPFMIWNLLIQAVVEVHHSKEQKKLENTITQSKSLSHEFKVIREYFE